MATITGLTASRMAAIEAESVVGGTVNGSGHLILTKHDSSTIDAGSVIGPKGDKGDTGATGPPSIALNAWPVGSIFIAAVSTSPATLLGGGTWARFGQGRVLVSQNSADTEFDTLLETGGEKKHTLTEAEMPSHNHSGGTGVNSVDHTHTVSTGAGGNTSSVNLRASAYNNSGTGVTTGGFPSNGASATHTHPIPNDGSGTAHNILQPYIVVYMWQRTA